MSGHSKWATIKRQKAVTDGKRAKVWARITRDIMVAAREGGGDVSMNPRLALSVDKGKAANMPKDNIERAIKRGTGEIQGEDFQEMIYEGYASGGVAILVEALTDNPNRTVADLRAMFSRAGGSLGQSGSVAFMFDRKGVFEIDAGGRDELETLELVADAGAEDLEHEGDTYVVTTPVEAFGDVQKALEASGIEPREAELRRSPTTHTQVDESAAEKVLALMEKIDDHQDIQNVYSTIDPALVPEKE